MTLTRGRLVGYEFDRMVVLFSMADSQKGNTLTSRPPPPDQREAQFIRLRGQIAERADRKFLAMEFEGSPPALSCVVSASSTSQGGGLLLEVHLAI